MTTAPLAIRPPYTIRERWLAAYRDWRRGRRDLEPGQTPAQLALMTIQRIGRIGAIPNDIMDMRVRSPIGRKPAWWQVAGKTCVAAYQPLGAASLAASYTNLANPGTYDAAPGTAPTFAAATGWTFDGWTQYLTIGIVMLAGWSYIVRVSDSSSTSGRVVGAADGGYVGINNIAPYVTAASWELRLGGSTKTCNQDGRNAVLCGAGNRAYHNGIDVGGVTPSTYSSKPLFIGALSLDGTPVFHFAGKVQAFAAYSATLTAGEVAAVSAAMAALTG